MTLIGKVIATEKYPTTIDEFCFWTDTKLILNPFDVVKVNHINESSTFGVIEEISHITDSASFLSNYISNDFGDVNATENTYRIGMNYVKAKVVGNNKNIFNPVLCNHNVYLATKDEVSEALGLDDVRNPLVCGYLEMYKGAGEDRKITLPVNIDSNFLIGPEGAHLNISGISGLASKTSYAMFLMKALQDKCIEDEKFDDVAYVIFNVKGKDLLAIDKEADFESIEEKQEVQSAYEALGMSTEPFKNVKYFYPYSDAYYSNTYADKELYEQQISCETAYKYKFEYALDKENLDLMFSNIEDSTQTMDSIINYIISGQGSFNSISSWPDFISHLNERCQARNSNSDKEIPVTSWRKFSRIAKKCIMNNPLFGETNEADRVIRLNDSIRTIKKNDVFVVDIAKLNADMQSFVFGNVIRAVSDLQLGEYCNYDDVTPPSKIVIFIDELNKYASKETPNNSPILRQVLDIAERGRSLGIILFGAEQFKSAIHNRVTGNCSTYAYGRTNAIEIANKDYSFIPPVYKSMMSRLKQGEYIIQNPVFRSLLNIKFPKPIYKQYKSSR